MSLSLQKESPGPVRCNQEKHTGTSYSGNQRIVVLWCMISVSLLRSPGSLRCKEEKHTRYSAEQRPEKCRLAVHELSLSLPKKVQGQWAVLKRYTLAPVIQGSRDLRMVCKKTPGKICGTQEKKHTLIQGDRDLRIAGLILLQHALKRLKGSCV